MVWLNLTPAEADAIAELDALADRAAAIVGATILEARLAERLRAVLLDLKVKSGVTLHGEMFRSSGPLGAFSTQLNLGFMLKLYDETTWRDLDLIRHIRNDFSHITEIGSFNAQSVSNRCAKLKACDLYFEEAPKEKVLAPLASFTGSTARLHHTFYTTGLAERRSKPRERYLLCIMYYVMFLRFPLVFGLERPGIGQFLPG